VLARLRRQAGLTLIELLIGMSVLSIALAFIYALLSSIYNSGVQTIEAGTLQDEARLNIDQMVADLRQAYTGDPSTSPIAAISATSITFYSPDRLQPFRLRKISYQISGTSLQRAFVTSSNTSTTGPPWNGLTTLGPWTTLFSSIVANPGGTAVFQYQKADGSTATLPQDVATVIVTITAKATGSHTAATTYSSAATLRASLAS